MLKESIAVPKLLTLAEAAEILRWDQKALRNAARRGKIPGFVRLPDGNSRFDSEIFLKWLQESMVTT